MSPDHLLSPRMAFVAGLLFVLLLAGCSSETDKPVEVTLHLSHPMSVAGSVASEQTPLLALVNSLVSAAEAAAVSDAFPFLGEMVLEVIVNGVSIEQINRDYNRSSFNMASNAPGLRLVNTDFSLYVPNRAGLYFRITAYNHAGVRLYSGESTLAQALAAGGALPVRLAIDIDPAIPRLVSGTGCTDSDGDTICDQFEELFVTLQGVDDLDGDTLANAFDTDADGDGIADAVELITASNDGFPLFVRRNSAPVAVSGSDLQTDEDTLSGPGQLVIDDPDLNDIFTLVEEQAPANGTLVISGLDYRYQPNADFNGSDSFTLRLSDLSGLSVLTAPINVVVKPVNDAPIALPDQFTTGRNQPLLLNPVLNDEDVDLDPLALLEWGQPSSGTLVKQGGELLYTPAFGFQGVANFSYMVSDGRGGTAQGGVVIEVVFANQNPLLTPQSVTTAEEQSLAIDLLASASDPDADPLSLFDFTQPAHGTLTDQGGGVVSYQPQSDYFGPDSFSYRISDDKGGLSSAQQPISVTPVNDAPVAVTDTLTTGRNAPLLLNPLLNDSDIEADPLSLLSWTQPSNGSVAAQGAELLYTPDSNYVGPDSFSYQLSDGQGGQSTGLVEIEVLASNLAPTLKPQSQTTAEDTPLIIDLLATATDPNGDPLSLTGFTNPAFGTLVDLGGGLLNYTPLPDYFGVDSFEYTVSDDQGTSSTATQPLLVTPVNDPPVALADSYQLPIDSSLILNPVLNDSDPEGDSLSLEALLTQPLNGSLSSNADGTLTYTPAPGYVGADSFDYRVTDGRGGSASATVSLTVIDRSQQVSVAPAIQSLSLNSLFSLQVNYQTSDNLELLSGLGLRIHFDTTRLTWLGFPTLHTFALLGRDLQPQADVDDYDQDPMTDAYVQVAWSDLAAQWPGGVLPAQLYTIQFQIRPDAPLGITRLRFSASSSASGYLFLGSSAEIDVVP